MARTVGPETSVPNHIKTPGNYPKEEELYTSNHGESLKFSSDKRNFHCPSFSFASTYYTEGNGNVTKLNETNRISSCWRLLERALLNEIKRKRRCVALTNYGRNFEKCC
jgi:hypothetical protein